MNRCCSPGRGAGATDLPYSRIDMGTKKRRDEEYDVPVRVNGTDIGWTSTSTVDGGTGWTDQRPIPIVRIDSAVLRDADDGSPVTLVPETEQILVLFRSRILGQVSAHHERLLRAHSITSGVLTGVTQDPPRAGLLIG